MSLTVFGVLVLLIGALVMLRGSTLAMLCFVMLATLLGGSAAFILGGGSSVLPSIEAVLLLAVRCIIPTHRPVGALRSALAANAPLILFALYGIIGALTLPRIFAGAMDVQPLRPIATIDPYATQALGFTQQNITSAGYLFTTMLGGICAFAAVRAPGSERRIARVAILIAFIHAGLGFAGVTFANTPIADLLNLFRNGLYNQVEQDVAGLARMNGIFAEPSSFAGFALLYFVFMTELWLRGVEQRASGIAALLLFVTLIVATSSTGYIGLATYAVVLGFRQLFFPATAAGGKFFVLVGLFLGGVAAGVAVVLVRPEYYELAEKIYTSMVLNKSQSESGLVRLSWARQGIAAFWTSGGLGVGAGSFRSSSLATAILGSMGVFGVVTYVLYVVRIIQPLRQSTFVPTGDTRTDVGVAAAWTAVVWIVPACVSLPSADPGLNWALMAGIALGLRSRAAVPSRRLSYRHETVANPA